MDPNVCLEAELEKITTPGLFAFSGNRRRRPSEWSPTRLRRDVREVPLREAGVCAGASLRARSGSVLSRMTPRVPTVLFFLSLLTRSTRIF